MTETTMTRRRGRKLAGILAGALALGMVPFAVPASAQTDPLPAQRDITQETCPVDDNDTPNDPDDDTTQVPEDGFADVATTNVHEFSIDCIIWYEVAQGTSATTYNPGGSVKRDQMASFIANLIDYAADPDHQGTNGPGQALPSAPTGNQFPCDLTTGNIHFNNIQRLAEADIIQGTGSSTAGACYEPGGNVTRAQMATFIKNAQDFINEGEAGFPIDPVAADYFADDEGDTHENNINIIASESIARGTGTNANNEAVYSPGDDIKRDQMATFLANKLDFLVEGDVIVPPPVVVNIEVQPDTTPDQGTDIDVEVTVERVAEIEAISVSGCGITGTDLDPQDFDGNLNLTETATGLSIPASQPTGPCTLTVETEVELPSSGDTVTLVNAVEITVNAA